MVTNGHRDRDIDANHASVSFFLEAASRTTVAGEDGSSVAPPVVFDQLHALLVRVDPHHAQDRPEDLILVDRHFGGHIVEQRHASEEPVVVELCIAAIDHDGCASSSALADIVVDSVARFFGDKWPHLTRRVGTVADDQFVHANLDRIDQWVCDAAHGNYDGDRHATFSSRTVSRAHR